MTYGLNAGQWITLHAAKLGSGFATTGWILFNQKINDNPIDAATLVAHPKIPDLKEISAFMMISHACRQGYSYLMQNYGGDIQMYLVKERDGGGAIDPPSYEAALAYTNGEDIHIRIGHKNAEMYTSDRGGVFPFCGEIVLQGTEPLKNDAAGTPVMTSGHIINEAYYYLIINMWQDNGVSIYSNMAREAQEYMARRLENGTAEDPSNDLKREIVEQARKDIEQVRPAAVTAGQNEIEEDDTYETYGWGGAALWYTQIANVNGKITSAALNKPQIRIYPKAMAYTCEENQQQNDNTAPVPKENPKLRIAASIMPFPRLESCARG